MLKCLPTKPKKYVGPDRMPPLSGGNLDNLECSIRTWKSPHREQAIRLMNRVGVDTLFRTLHAMRRWYSGQTMTGALRGARSVLEDVMDLSPGSARGIYRGFKIDVGDDLARKLAVGAKIVLPIERNSGISSWSIEESQTNKFSGGGKGKIGVIVRLTSVEGITVLLAPPSHTDRWFNALYEYVIGNKFRPIEGEFLIAADRVRVEVIRVKR
jgi:hypothetical protein